MQRRMAFVTSSINRPLEANAGDSQIQMKVKCLDLFKFSVLGVSIIGNMWMTSSLAESTNE